MTNENKPVVFIVFANDRDDSSRYLRNLAEETKAIEECLMPAVEAGICELVVRTDASADDVVEVFLDARYRDRIAVFHFGGHANGYSVLLEGSNGKPAAVNAGGLSEFLGQQLGLHLVFLNGCSTVQQTQGLLDANIPVVIATSQDIQDESATNFASKFYAGLAGGANIGKAFRQGAASTKMVLGDNLRGAYFSQKKDIGKVVQQQRWPWRLASAHGDCESWSIPLASGDPLFGLPSLPESKLPQVPYRHLSRFTREEASVFFGRGRQIRDLYERIESKQSSPLIFVYGQSGVGKSSMLDAGLLPRLAPRFGVAYVRRKQDGLNACLREALKPRNNEQSIHEAWLAKEQRDGKPFVVFLDQIEEVFTRLTDQNANELDRFLEVLRSVFGNPERRPAGKIVLGFRKEWLAEFDKRFSEFKLSASKVFVEPLDRDGIIEVVQGLTSSTPLRSHYGLSVDETLPVAIADALLEDRDSPVAPTLQVLLTKLWQAATEENQANPRFSLPLYQRLKSQGLLLRDFLSQQIEKFHAVHPQVAESGLLLDILARHTTHLGTANSCGSDELVTAYSHVQDQISKTLQTCQDLYLTTVVAAAHDTVPQQTSLAHDTLAPLVRERFDESDKPGQRARRILDNRSLEWVEGDGTPLEAADLAIVEAGLMGTRALNPSEQRMVQASIAQREKNTRTRKRVMAAGVGLLLGVIGLGVLGWVQRGQILTNLSDARNATAQAKTSATEARKKEGQAVSARNLLLRTFDSARGDKDGKDVTVYRCLVAALPEIRESRASSPENCAVLLTDIGDIFLSLSQYAEYRELNLEAAEIFDELGGEFDADTIEASLDAALALGFLGKGDESLRELNALRAKATTEKQRLLIELEIGKALWGQKKRDQAIQTLEKALPRCEKGDLADNLGEFGSTTLGTIRSLAEFYSEIGKLPKAIELLDACYKRSVRHKGEDDIQAKSFQNSLMGMYYANGQLDMVRPIMVEQLEDFNASLGEDHSYSILTAGNLATVELSLKNTERAIELCEEKIGYAKELFLNGLEYRFMVRILSPSLVKVGRFEDEHPLGWLNSMKTTNGWELPYEWPNVYQVLANLYLEKKEYERAIKFAELALDQRDNVENSDHEYFQIANSILGAAKSQREDASEDDIQEAKALLVAGFEGIQARFDKMTGFERWHLAAACQRVVDYYERRKNKPKVAEWKAKLKAAAQRIAK